MSPAVGWNRQIDQSGGGGVAGVSVVVNPKVKRGSSHANVEGRTVFATYHVDYVG